MPDSEEVPKYGVGDLLEVKISIFDSKKMAYVPTKRHYLITEVLLNRFGRYRVFCIETGVSHVEIFQYYDRGHGTKVN
jgi:hypothetical protein